MENVLENQITESPKVNITFHDEETIKNELCGDDKIIQIAHQLGDEIKNERPILKDVNLIDEVKKMEEELITSYLRLTKILEKKSLTPAAEWYLDNFHIIEEQLRNIKRDLPKDFYKELPKNGDGTHNGYPRVYVIAKHIIELGDARVDIATIEKFILAIQDKFILTIGEIWAIAITLRISLIKSLLPIVRRIINSLDNQEKADELADEIIELAVISKNPSPEMIKKLNFCLKEGKKFNRQFIVKLIQRLRGQDQEVYSAMEWIDEFLTKCATQSNELIQQEYYRQAADQVLVGNIITSMRLFSEIDWHDFFEKVSHVEIILKNDPTKEYSLMDTQTKDSYRKAVENLSRGSKLSEIEITEIALTESKKSNRHIGHFLIGEDVNKIRKKISYTLSPKEKIISIIENNPGTFYLGSIASIIVLFEIILFNQLARNAPDFFEIILFLTITSIPISELALSAFNFIITLTRKPARLPKMDFKQGIPQEYSAMVVVPCLLTDPDTIKELIHNLEVQYIANSDPNISFALLADFPDAIEEVLETDQMMIDKAFESIRELNLRYSNTSKDIFYLFYRKRIYNSGENKWMGWERKRGKIEEFNQLIRGKQTTSFVTDTTNLNSFLSIKYIITLDADTQLPIQSASKMIGTISHPLNRPVIDEKNKVIKKGYGIIQPRVSISLISASKTRFAQIFSGNTGIDPYTTAVSDVYQDLFSEGSFVGKGLYDVDVFIKVLENRIPENSILSHDLFEGSFARVGLTSDIELIDDYPESFDIFSKRMHRWTRGDWQLLPWLFPKVKNASNKKVRNDLSALSRWKIFDNLRRSLTAPITFIWLILSWIYFSGSPFHWTLIVIVVTTFPIYAMAFHDLLKGKNIPWAEHFRNNIRSLRNRIEQGYMMLVFMPQVSFTQLDAVLKAIYRMSISKKNLLEWVSFSQTRNTQRKYHHLKLLNLAGVSLGGMLLLYLIFYKEESLITALPFMLTWFMAPYIEHATRRPIPLKEEPLNKNEINQFRRYARLTWHYFETFATKDENWLAPDNFQESPNSVIAHRTSPTNIGLQLLSNLSAYDFGYIGLVDFVEKTENVFEVIHKLEKYNGHLFNWYDTQTLSPLHPRYVSTVDSGNLAGHLITLKQSCLELAKFHERENIFLEGIKDSIFIYEEYLNNLLNIPSLPRTGSLKRIHNALGDLKTNTQQPNWEDIQNILYTSKKLFNDVDFTEHKDIIYRLHCWLDSMIKQVNSFKKDFYYDQNNIRLRLKTIAYQAHELAHAMDFKFLYDQQRKIFSIGFNFNEGKRDNSFYDLLASEARLTSYFAISKGDIPNEHWFRLGRQLTNVAGSRALISWSASMFEYMMPLLIMKRFEDTLLDQTYETIVKKQIEYGQQRKIPWGVSESGYNSRDLDFNYQYGPFGIPGLGLKRGLKDEVVISPYSSMLAAMIKPRHALSNLVHLEKNNALGSFGFYEAIDYTSQRVPKNKKFAIIESYMAHHQGMTLVSLNNLLNQGLMQERFHTDARNQAVQLLLQERIPPVTEITKPRIEETHVESFFKLGTNDQTRSYFDFSPTEPQTQILSNGHYSVMLSTAGCGYSKFHGKFIFRWREDLIGEMWGNFIFIKNKNNKKIWSSGFMPTRTLPKKYEVSFSENKIDILREDDQIKTLTEIIISSEDNIELRKISLTNNSNTIVELEVTSFEEITLAAGEDDGAHQAFSKLFIQTEYCPEINTLLATRRSRTGEEDKTWALHSLYVIGESIGGLEFETDRTQFIGRGGSILKPRAMKDNEKLTHASGAVLDPIFSLRQRIRIPPKETAQVIFLNGVAQSKEEAKRLAEKYHDPNNFQREVSLGWVKSQMTLRHLNISTKKAHLFQQLASHILYHTSALRPKIEVSLNSRLSKSDLWSQGISGDLPIVLIRVHEDEDVTIVREFILAQEYLRYKGIEFDLIILNEHPTSYQQTLQDEINRQVLISGGHHLLDKKGGIFIRRSDLLTKQELDIMKVLSRVHLVASAGNLEDHLRRRSVPKDQSILLRPTQKRNIYKSIEQETPKLKYFNGFGGFSEKGDEYIIHLKDSVWTPAPWINVISNNKNFGSTVSEAGQGHTWSINSRENRLTPWTNDPVTDLGGEMIFIRDEENGNYWSPTPLSARASSDYLVRHGAGYSIFKLHFDGIEHELTVFVPKNDEVKISVLKFKNTTSLKRKLGIYYFVEWILGFSNQIGPSLIQTQWEQDTSTIFAMNPLNSDFTQRVSFISSSEKPESFTCDRKEFIGRNNDLASAAAMNLEKLSGIQGLQTHACGAIQVKIDLKPGEEKEIIFLLGQADGKEKINELSSHFKISKNAWKAFDSVKDFWNDTCSTIEIQTPEESINFLVNHWLIYQTLSCRYWGRTALYQSGGAWGFRDQLQDIMALIYSHPEIAKSHILLCASRQFPQGDVQHWWHPPKGQGVRTKFADDLLWLPYVVSFYIQITEDYSILDEVVSFIEAPQLPEEEDENYTLAAKSDFQTSLYDHCLRAINKSLKNGVHGLPLFGSGDWNDGMNRVGHKGQGESVWMGWFLGNVIKNFLPLCHLKEDSEKIKIFEQHLFNLTQSLDQKAWDGQWYLRGWFDDGTPLGSKNSQECQIDSISQSWSILSGLGNKDKSIKAMQAVDGMLVDRKNNLVKLFTPPFDKTPLDPGYIKGYLPGIRENGGQYTHAAIWAMIALVECKEIQKAHEILQMINPINHTLNQKMVNKYKVEPYVIAADIYGVDPHKGRGGWTWYTGSAGWMYRAIIEYILGFKLKGNKLTIKPCVPINWEKFQITYRKNSTTHLIKIFNHQDNENIYVDDNLIAGPEITLVNDGVHHEYRINFKNQVFKSN